MKTRSPSLTLRVPSLSSPSPWIPSRGSVVRLVLAVAMGLPAVAACGDEGETAKCDDMPITRGVYGEGGADGDYATEAELAAWLKKAADDGCATAAPSTP